MVSRFDFVPDPISRIAFEDAFTALTSLELWPQMKATYTERVIQYMKSLEDKPEKYDNLLRAADRRMMHSIASFARTLREMEHIAKVGFEKWKWKHIRQNRPDMVKAARKISEKWYEFSSDPHYALCRNRLRREFLVETAIDDRRDASIKCTNTS